ncbi:patatin-like phospholipase family protein [Variovorax sp. J22R133]|uniref:patatin-like phospholipase family protein n=1 Tax=Variovorax brevis TaxID=3053503 RepID=UPI002577423F|nr:patatin-like phospholipase family protein [Variovorax sp. J22R133]MDM0111116.1 patatin-like phospholipase family protein [Variovorax sp. J22R133]
MDYIEEQVKARRTALKDDEIFRNASGVWGLALSGGGIRSATFCLGVLRALAHTSTFRRFDLLSTVSGGGYIGAMLGRFFSRAPRDGGGKEVEKQFGEADNPWFLWWLRANGRYLIPHGAKDTTFAVALFIRNLFAVHFELGLLAVLLGLALSGLDLLGWWVLAWLGFVVPTPLFPALQGLPPWFITTFPVAWLALPVIALIGAARASAYWSVLWVSSGKRLLPAWLLGFALTAILIGLYWWLPVGIGPVGRAPRQIIWIATSVLLILWLCSVPICIRYLKKVLPGDPHPADSARTNLTQALARTFRVFSIVALAGIVDRCAWFIAFEMQAVFELGQAELGLWLAIAAAVIRAVVPMTSKLLPGATGTASVLMVGRVLGYLLTFLLCVWWVSLVQTAVLGAAFVGGIDGVSYLSAAGILFLIAAPAVVYVIRSGSNVQFLNLSSLHAFYRARLVRSYLGAANGDRFDKEAGPLAALGTVHPVPKEKRGHRRVDDVEFDDDISISDYQPQASGGPVHILSACVNQTRDPRGGLFNQDRRGLNLSVASGGYKKVSQGDWEPMPKETALTLGTWMAVSGAAFAPGLGAATRGGISALATFAGVRLGFWWDKATRENSTNKARFCAKSAGMVSETFGHFEGTEGDDWFLTDGGHFENTAAYALLAERAEVIVLADCGADPQYAFEDLENLVRKARIDFQAEILFCRRPDAQPAERPAQDVSMPLATAARSDALKAWPVLSKFGSLNDLASSNSSACLALATITYCGEKRSTGILIVIKPNLCSGLPVDLVNFKEQHPDFPQETTVDQFFSEAQWESYYHLGTFLGGELNRAFLECMVHESGKYFVPDDCSPFEARRKRKADVLAAAQGAMADPMAAGAAGVAAASVASAAAGSKRLPSRIAAPATVGAATLSFGAIATVGIATWQAIDTAKSAYEKQLSDERSALRELTEAWVKAVQAPANDNNTALSTLAAVLVRTADNLCPTDDAQWFRNSDLAQTVFEWTKGRCETITQDGKPEVCSTFLMSINSIKGAGSSCLRKQGGVFNVFPRPRYWIYDYTGTADRLESHPCDQVAIDKTNQILLAQKERPFAYREDCRYGGRFALTPDQLMKHEQKAKAELGARPSVPSSAPAPKPAPPPAPVPAPAPVPTPATTTPAAGTPSAVAPSSPPPPPPPVTPPQVPTAPPPAATTPPEPPKAVEPPQATTPVPSSPGTPTGKGPCTGITVYIQIHGPEMRNVARGYREQWRSLGASVPPIDDVVASARTRGRASPSPVRQTTVRYHDDASVTCAYALGYKLGGSAANWKVEPLGPRFTPTPNTVEVWIPPATVPATAY